MAYATTAGIYGIFGTTNTRKWANTTGQMPDTEIDDRLSAAIAWADALVDDMFRKSKYLVPLQAEGGGSLAVIADAASKLAGTWLYQSRGMRDGGSDDRLQAVRADAEETLGEYVRGARGLAAVEVSGSSGVPEVVL